MIFDQTDQLDVDRVATYRALARRVASGEVFVSPATLSKEARRLHVRRTLREDHRHRIRDRPEGARAKFDKLSASVFHFFRGTALLYYRDQAGSDGDLPTVFAVGDIHPENFGVMPNADGAPFFGVNDFDEAYFAPFSWDVKRGAVGFDIVAKEQGLSGHKRRKVVKAFVRGYLDGLMELAQDDREKWHQFQLDNSPKMIVKLLKSALESRQAFLADMIDLDTGRFVPSDEIVPRSGDIERFQRIIDRYRERSDVAETGRAGHFEVKDVAVKKGSGTASLGLDRFFVLIAGGTDRHTDDIVLELKQARRSALHGLVPDDRLNSNESDQGEDASNQKAKRIVASHDVHLAAGDPYYGETEIDGVSFLVRERSPYKDDIDVDDLNKKALKRYARICGRALAQPHARSDDDTGVMDGDAERRILASINATIFVADVVRFAENTRRRIYRDHALFKKDHALDAFQFVD